MTGCLITRNKIITILVLYSDGSRQSLMRAKSAAPWNGPVEKRAESMDNIANMVVYTGKTNCATDERSTGIKVVEVATALSAGVSAKVQQHRC
jgi:hypothetical protein